MRSKASDLTVGFAGHLLGIQIFPSVIAVK